MLGFMRFDDPFHMARAAFASDSHLSSTPANRCAMKLPSVVTCGSSIVCLKTLPHRLAPWQRNGLQYQHCRSGAWGGGLIVADLGLLATLWFSAIVVLCTLGLTTAAGRLDRHDVGTRRASAIEVAAAQ